MNHTEKLIETIEKLIQTGREDDWWDFKECHHEDKAALLHDIICLSNNRANKDAYLIFGIRDKTFEIIGIEADPKRRNQQNIVDFLRTPNFAGQTRPRVEVRTIMLDPHEVDVFIIKNSTDVPYYLIENYSDKKYKPDPPKKGKIVQAFHIYTRVMDNNTPINDNADIRDIEYLWKKRFGLLQTPLEQIKILLQHPDDWEEEDCRYYHKLFPQYTIFIEYDEDEDGISKEGNREFYHYLQYNTSAYYGTLKISHYNTQLFSCQITELDGHRMTAPCPKWFFINNKSYTTPDICSKYYVETDLQYLLLQFLEKKIGSRNGGDAQIATRRLMEAVLLFEDEQAVQEFYRYVSNHLEELKFLVSQQRTRHIDDSSERVRDVESKRIKEGYALKMMQKKWQKMKLEGKTR